MKREDMVRIKETIRNSQSETLELKTEDANSLLLQIERQDNALRVLFKQVDEARGSVIPAGAFYLGMSLAYESLI